MGHKNYQHCEANLALGTPPSPPLLNACHAPCLNFITHSRAFLLHSPRYTVPNRKYVTDYTLKLHLFFPHLFAASAAVSHSHMSFCTYHWEVFENLYAISWTHMCYVVKISWVRN